MSDDGGIRSGTARRLLADERFVAILLVGSVGLLGPNAASPALPSIAGALGVSDARIGLVMTVFFLPSVVMIPLVGVTADIYGRRRIVLASLLVFGAAGTAIAFVDGFLALLVLRGVQGAGFAGLSPITVTLIGDLYSGPEGSTAQGLRISAHSVTDIAVPAVAGLVAGIAWNYPFFLYAAALLVFAFTFVALPETGEAAGVDDGSTVAATFAGYLREIRSELADPDLALLLAGGIALFFIKSAFVTFVPLFVVRALGESAFVAGALLSARGVVRFLVSPLSGRVVARVPRKRGLIATAVTGLAGTALLPFAPSVAWLVPVTVVFSAGDALFTSLLNDAVATMATDERRGGVIGGLSMGKSFGNTVAPALLGLVLAAAGFEVTFAVAAGIMLAYVLVLAAFLDPGIAA